MPLFTWSINPARYTVTRHGRGFMIRFDYAPRLDGATRSLRAAYALAERRAATLRKCAPRITT
jgi:hypothetical protein